MHLTRYLNILWSNNSVGILSGLAGVVDRLLMHELHHDESKDEMRFMLGHHLVRPMTSMLKELLTTPEGDWFKGKLTRHDHFEALARIYDTLNRVPKEFVVEDRRRFMASYFGHFMSIHRELKFLGGAIHQLLLRELDL
ncbi:hypothetical protein Ddye_026605 [Dipteronia dyeriana]|uniref:Uncharacterized protein n=1 Tax=Dipteronia dyeriana TaxID=168575 RepID=A0AAD9TMJ2_9ROSI|nr:hypothetical protein Ddye_026605 [Dipteronia dyeriana]